MLGALFRARMESTGIDPFSPSNCTIAINVLLVSRSADSVRGTDFRAGHQVVGIIVEMRELVERAARFACHCKHET